MEFVRNRAAAMQGSVALEGLLKLGRALAGQEDPEQKGNQQKTKTPDNDCGSRASAAAVAIAVAVAVEARRLRIWILNPADWLQGRT